MKTAFSRIWFPAAVVSAMVAQLISVETPSQDFTFSVAPQTDTIIYKNKFASRASAESENDSLFVLEAVADTNRITARDTMKVPDSLKFADPFRYKYYVATVDSLTHTIVRDSLKAAGDTLDWPKIDSLYLADSVAKAKDAFAKWYAGLSPAEKKKYDYEQKINAKLHRADSIAEVKQQKKDLRDSILEATPRVLQTFAMADSLQYKRIIRWTHDRQFHQITNISPDTTYNERFHDYPYLRKDVGATWLGTPGSALQTYDFFQRNYTEDVAFYEPFESWAFSPETLPLYNTKTPYTELAYWGSLFATREKESDNLHILTSSNITPEFNYTLSYDRFGSGGMLLEETTKNKNVVASANYLGKKYLMHAGYIYNMVSQKENGGIIDNTWIRDTVVDAREIQVNLNGATSLIKKNTFFVDQQLRIPFEFINNLRAKKDSNFVADDNVTTAFIGHSSEFSTYRRIYQDNENASSSRFYDNFYLTNGPAFDSLRVMKLDNKVFIRLQPWASDGIISKLNVGVGNKIMKWYDQDPTMLYTKNNTVWNSTYLYAGAEGQLKKYIHWDATGGYTFMGYQMNDLYLKGNLALNFYPFRRAKNSPVSINGHFETSLKEPDHYQQRLVTNHFKWNNDFDKISTTKIQGSIDIPRWKFSVSAGYALLDKNIYYDTLGIVRQNTTPMSVFNVAVKKNITLFNTIHLDNRVLFQKSSNETVMPLPAVALNARYYLEFDVVKNVLRSQLGADVYYTTKWYASAWNPSVGAFQNQNKEKYGNCPYIDAFVNLQWKRASIYVKLQNAGMGWPMDSADYFSAAGHIMTQRVVKFGVYWPFYTLSGMGHSHGSSGSGSSSSRSSSSSSSRSSGGMSSARSAGRSLSR